MKNNKDYTTVNASTDGITNLGELNLTAKQIKKAKELGVLSSIDEITNSYQDRWDTEGEGSYKHTVKVFNGFLDILEVEDKRKQTVFGRMGVWSDNPMMDAVIGIKFFKENCPYDLPELLDSANEYLLKSK